MAKTQIGVSILILLFISAIGDSLAAPQICNVFIGCNVTIKVCKIKCRHRYRGSRDICITGPPSTPRLSTEMQILKDDKCPCRCTCIFPKAANQPCPKNVTTLI
ncbi:hypothetical protein ACP275_08G247100 [Erythranthe tilingii]